MYVFFRIWGMVLLLNFVLGFHSATIPSSLSQIGRPAPPLSAASWIQGEAISRFQPGRVYVIEFWATWCGPCIKELPHLSKLASKYRQSASFVALNIWDQAPSEDSDPKSHAPAVTGRIDSFGAYQARIKRWVLDHKNLVSFSVAVDSKSESVSESWMKPFLISRIPTTFIVDQSGRVAWIGHPKDIDRPLDQIVNRTYDLHAFRKQFDGEFERARKQIEAKQVIGNLATKKQWAKFREKLDSLSNDDPAAIANAVLSASKSDPNYAVALIAEKSQHVPPTVMPSAVWIQLLSVASEGAKEDETRASAALLATKLFPAVSPRDALTRLEYAKILLFDKQYLQSMKQLDQAEKTLNEFYEVGQRKTYQGVLMRLRAKARAKLQG